MEIHHWSKLFAFLKFSACQRVKIQPYESVGCFNQSAESSDVAFVKGVKVRNK